MKFSTEHTPVFNLKSEFSAACFETIEQNDDLCNARERIKKQQEDGSSIKETFYDFTTFAAGDYAKASTNMLGKHFLGLMRDKD